MNVKQIQERFGAIYAKVVDRGEMTPPEKRELKALDDWASKLQDTGESWEELFELRQEIAELLNSEAALFV